MTPQGSMDKVKPKITASDIKRHFVKRAYFDDYVIAHEVDFLYKPDIVTVRRNLKVCEYEIKVSWQDLNKELNTIEFVLQEDDQIKPPNLFDMANRDSYYTKMRNYYKGNKYYKHRHYLKGITQNDKLQAPNLFYFILPRELYERAESRIAKLPYGVIDHQCFYCLKKPVALHKEPVNIMQLWHIAHNLTNKEVLL
jgi:hypothetical protein